MSDGNLTEDVPDYDTDVDHEALEVDWDGWEDDLRAAARVFGVPS